MPPANPTYYPGDLRRELLDQAVEMITEAGPAGLSLRSLARRLGVSHAAPANHFPSKADLFAAVARLGLAYLAFAADRRGHFLVMFRHDL